ncbi:MAG: hypothetical protein HN757_16480 [Calditrichaeota bacterium]|nr:hypothetical protein [Calditrichota bacterium]
MIDNKCPSGVLDTIEIFSSYKMHVIPAKAGYLLRLRSASRKYSNLLDSCIRRNDGY